MIGKLNGKIDSIFTDHLIIDVGGVGYRVFCSGKTLNKLEIGSSASLLIETNVREDHIHLYGFLNSGEKNLFLLLTTVKGVGNKVGLAILGAMSIEQISNSILANDKTAYKLLPGVGPKIWERIIIELKDKVVGSIYNLETQQNPNTTFLESNETSQDAISALVNLGINKSESYRIVHEILLLDPNINLNDLIKKSLRQLAK